MSEWFQHNLMDLLPPLYADKDGSGDLRTFLSLPATTLDELKAAMDQLPGIFDVDHCDERFLPLLAYLVGHTYDGTDAPATQRRLIRESVEIYRRKGTLPAMNRSLGSIGWEGNIEETFRQALRLNTRSQLNAARLPGQVFSLGVYRVNSFNLAEGVREVLDFHHPAGTRAFFLQWLACFIEGSVDLKFQNATHVRSVVLAFLDETFVLGRSQLGACRHLTNKQRVYDYIQLTSTVEMCPEIDRAANKVSRFQGRQNSLRLNQKTLNQVKTPHVSIREDQLSFCNPIYTGREYSSDIIESGFHLSADNLNHRRLSFADAERLYCFRQKDLFTVLKAENSEARQNRQTFGLNTETRNRQCFQLGRSPLNGNVVINAIQGGHSCALLVAAVGCKAGVTEASTLINRWRRRGPVFKLNANDLNNRALTNANLTGERASLEVYMDTGSLQRSRVVPLNLNKRALNTTSLRFSVDRTRPLRIGRMKLNQAGFRFTEPSHRWLFRQQDLIDAQEAAVESATNQYTVTQWPI
jgi:phage tail-like protein